MKTLLHVIVAGLLVVGLSPVAAHAAVSCFNFHVIVTSDTQICTSYCTQCDFIGPDGEDEGYISSCSDPVCIDKEV